MKKIIIMLAIVSMFTACQIVDEVEKEINKQIATEPSVDPIAPLIPQVYNVHFQTSQYVWQQDCVLYYHGAYVPIGNYEYRVFSGDGTTLLSGSKNGGDENDRYIPIVIKISQSPVTVILYSNDSDMIPGDIVTLTYNADSDSWIIDYGEEEAI